MLTFQSTTLVTMWADSQKKKKEKKWAVAEEL
jgi:hypothetical protein